MQLLIPVAVKPYIKKFIGHDYPVDPFVISTTNKYGMFLYHCISKPEKRVLRLVQKEPEIDRSIYPDQMFIRFTEKRYRELGCIISVENQIHFNKFVQHDFNEEFYKFVKHRIGPKGSINQAILNFRDIYGIYEDELSFKTIQRAFQRRNAPLTNSLSA